MSTKIAVNLPVKDLATSTRFFAELGFLYGRNFRDPDGHHWDVFCIDGGAPAAQT
jgi:predicted lactoylglutathione lyase